MNSSDSAEEVVRISLEGMEVALKIAGAGAKNIAVMVYTIMKDKQQTKGKTRLTNMLKTGKPLKIFTIRAEDLKKFSQEAKKYGVLYCALADKKNSKIDGMVDIMVREEDASKMNRIAERFNFRDVASIKRELEQEKNKVTSAKVEEVVKSEEDQFIDDIMPKEDLQQEIPSNDTKETEEKNPLEISSNIKVEDKTENTKKEKKSVKKELKEIEKEINAKELKQKEQEKQDIPIETVTKKENKNKKQENEKYKGKHFKEPKHLDNTPRKKKRKMKKERSK